MSKEIIYLLIKDAPPDFRKRQLLSNVRFPEENIGVNQFAKCINNAIDLNRSRKISGVEINRQLKKMGILAEELLTDDKKRTIVNANSSKYGIVTQKRNYNGNEYDMVCFNDIGKKFLLDELEKILDYEAVND